MNKPCGHMIGMQATLAEQWAGVIMSMIKWYSGILDPRPDLARPARARRAVYAWWW